MLDFDKSLGIDKVITSYYFFDVFASDFATSKCNRICQNMSKAVQASRHFAILVYDPTPIK